MEDGVVGKKVYVCGVGDVGWKLLFIQQSFFFVSDHNTKDARNEKRCICKKCRSRLDGLS